MKKSIQQKVAVKEPIPKKRSVEQEERFIAAIGRRKGAVASVRLFLKKDGSALINGKALDQYFPSAKLRAMVHAPFTATRNDLLQLEIKVKGGGLHGQAEAIRLGVARAFAEHKPEIRSQLRTIGLLTRDARVKERRKYGLKKARRAPQWAKR